MNGGIMELDFSDNSNSSFKDVIPVKTEVKQRDVIIINSDSNSSIPDKHDPQLDQQMPKKRGRKKDPEITKTCWMKQRVLLLANWQFLGGIQK